MLKRIILILTFVIPVAGVFVFNFLSESHFDIPVYHQERFPSDFNCPGIKLPYSISASEEFPNLEGDVIQPFNSNEIKIVAIDEGKGIFTAELSKIADEFNTHEIVDIYVFNYKHPDPKIPFPANITRLTAAGDLQRLKDCVLLITDSADNAVLVDRQNKIRGYYNLLDSELADSLIVETKILLYQKGIANGDK